MGWYPPSSNICIIYQSNRNMTALSAPGLLKPPPLFVATWHSRDDTFASSFTSSAFSWDENGASLHWVINDPILLGCLLRSSLYDTNPNNAPLWGNPSNLPCICMVWFPKIINLMIPFSWSFRKVLHHPSKISRLFTLLQGITIISLII